MAEESAEQRPARLEHLSALQKHNLAVETPEERAARLEHKRALQRQSLSADIRGEIGATESFAAEKESMSCCMAG